MNDHLPESIRVLLEELSLATGIPMCKLQQTGLCLFGMPEHMVSASVKAMIELERGKASATRLKDCAVTPFSKEIILRAAQFFEQIKQLTHNPSNLPTIRPAENGSIAFTWSHYYPGKELEVWLFDRTDYYAEWMISIDGEDEESIAQSEVELIKVFKKYRARLVRDESRKRKSIGLSKEAQQARMPPPPASLVGALQDTIHKEVERHKTAKASRRKRK